MRWWILVAAAIWVVIKLPQEYWIHIAQRDFTDTLAELTWLGPLLVGLALALALALWVWVRPRLRPADWQPRVAADPLPEEMDTAAEQAAWRAEHTTIVSAVTLEKVLLLVLLAVVFAENLPGVQATQTQLAVGVGAFVVVNAALALAAARRSLSIESLALTFVVRLGINAGLVLIASWLLGRGRGDLNEVNALFFVLLISLITTLHDRYQPVHAARVRAADAGG